MYVTIRTCCIYYYQSNPSSPFFHALPGCVVFVYKKRPARRPADERDQSPSPILFVVTKRTSGRVRRSVAGICA